MSSVLDVILWVVVAAGVLTAAAGSYLLVLAVAAIFYREGAGELDLPEARLVVLIPAHNEEDFLGRCLESFDDQGYPRRLFDIAVVADNCTDQTASIASRSGARVMVRDMPDAPGKGQALRWAMDAILAEPDAPDAVVIVDADSVVEPDFLCNLVMRFEHGADAVQAEYLALGEPGSTKVSLRATALLLFHRVRFTGRAVLGMPCSLVGNGMLLSRRLLMRQPWSAFTSAEDLEYSVDLRLSNVRPVFAGSARVWGPAPAGGRAARVQRQRWEGGRLHVVRTKLPRLIAEIVVRRRASLIDAAVDLAIPPLGLLALAAIVGTAISLVMVMAGSASVMTVVPWIAALVSIALFVVIGLRAAHAPRAAYLSLLKAPIFLMGKAVGTLQVVSGSGGDTWVRTARPSDTPADGDRRTVSGIPIDWVDMDTAIARIDAAARDRSFMQVSTVNLDFLVNSRRDREVRSILQSSALNLADGAPVVWLGKAVGAPARQRITGSDLVPRLVELAAAEQIPVFFLGGEHGSARLAADRLLRLHPSLRVTVYEPPRRSLEALGDDEIFRRLDEAGPAILLVAFGHPKQEKWIHRHRERLPMVAMGVGCSFDLIAGRMSRAPSWMQKRGLEWVYRLAHEPARLACRYATDSVWLTVVLFPLAVRQRLQGHGALEHLGKPAAMESVGE